MSSARCAACAATASAAFPDPYQSDRRQRVLDFLIGRENRALIIRGGGEIRPRDVERRLPQAAVEDRHADARPITPQRIVEIQEIKIGRLRSARQEDDKSAAENPPWPRRSVRWRRTAGARWPRRRAGAAASGRRHARRARRGGCLASAGILNKEAVWPHKTRRRRFPGPRVPGRFRRPPPGRWRVAPWRARHRSAARYSVSGAPAVNFSADW